MNIHDTIKSALQHYQSGNLQEAERLFLRVLKNQPDNGEVLYLLGIICGQLGKYDQAIQYIKRSLQLNPANAEACFALGITMQQKGQTDEALDYFQKSVNLDPNNAEALKTLGNTFKEKGRFDEAITCYQKAVLIDPNPPDADILYHNLGMSFQTVGSIDEAIGCYQKAVQINPNLLVAYNNLGIVLQKKGRFEEAAYCYQKALLIDPHSAETYYNLGVLLQGQGKHNEASDSYEVAISFRPDYIAARWAKCISQLPTIYPDQSAIEISRERYRQELTKLSESISLQTPQDIKAAVAAVGTQQPFHLPYQGLNDRELQQLYGNLVCKIMSAGYPKFSVTKETLSPPLDITPPSPPIINAPSDPPLSNPSRPPLKLRGGEGGVMSRGGRGSYEAGRGREGLRGGWGALSPPLRVGIVSGHFYSHPVWKIITKGWAENLDKGKIRLYGYSTAKIRDNETENARRCFSRFVENLYSFEDLCSTIVDDNLHAIIYPEIGMDPTTIRVAALRLAPLQCASWGHPDTSGLPTIDYFLSSALMEPPDGDDAYTERLVRLPNLSIYYTPQEATGFEPDRAIFGLRPESVLYHCCQTLFKFLPQYDEIFPRIAQKVGDCQFLFSTLPELKTVIDQFRMRIYRAFARFNLNAEDYFAFLPHLDQSEYNAMNRTCDVFLDPIGWSGCTSTLEAIDCNLPVVAFPSSLMRGRESGAILTMMGMKETIATSLDNYIDLAIKLGQDCRWRRGISEDIARNKHKLYRDRTCITALEDFLLEAVEERMK